VAAADQHRAGFVLLEVLLADLPAVLSRRHPQADAVRAVHHRPVGAAVHPVLFRVAHDHEVVGADVAAAVVLVKHRGREAQYVYVFPFENVFQNRAVLDDPRRNRLVALHPVAVGAHDIERMRRRREAEQDRKALRRVRRARDGAKTFGIAGNVLEQDRRRRLFAVDDLGEGAHLQLPVRAPDAAQLAGALYALDGLAQIGMRVLIVVPQPAALNRSHGRRRAPGGRSCW
jgi:hypothetical protein